MAVARLCAAVASLLGLAPLARGWGATKVCTDDSSCQARIASLTRSLDESSERMKTTHDTVQAIEELRSSVLQGKRLELPSARRQHLEQGSALISEVTFDARHRPLSTNISRHVAWNSTLAANHDVRYQGTLALKKNSGAAQKGVGSTLLVTLDAKSLLSIHSMDGELLLDRFNLGHSADQPVIQVALSTNPDNHLIMTGDDAGDVRVHNLRIVSKKDKLNMSSEEEEDLVVAKPAKKGDAKQHLVVYATLATSFSLQDGPDGEQRKLTALLPADRGTQIFFLVGDSMGGISVFLKNGTLKNRARVVEDDGGVRGFLRATGLSALFWSSYSFGFFSPTSIDVQYPPCSGWHAPVFDIASDPSMSYSRVVLALSDGDVLVWSTVRGKAKVCDLNYKFPHISTMPFRMQAMRGFVVGMQVAIEERDIREDKLRELFFFNLAAMEGGYGTAHSRAVSLQVSFRPKQPEGFSLLQSAGQGPANKEPKTQVLIRFSGLPGVEIYDLNLKMPVAPKVPGEPSEGLFGGDWLSWFPKIGIFGLALIAVVFWNIKKSTSTSSRGPSGMSDFDNEDLLQRIRERKRQALAAKAGGDHEGAGGFLGSSSSDSLGGASGEDPGLIPLDAVGPRSEGGRAFASQGDYDDE